MTYSTCKKKSFNKNMVHYDQMYVYLTKLLNFIFDKNMTSLVLC